jgi:prolyl-tRNA editing enzyme YbaK/EbsC (Cys-tRNA(Pro) deacylase)
MADLKPAAQRVQVALRDKGLEAQVRHMRQTTRSAEQAAAACGCSVGQIVKSLVFRGAASGKPYLLLVSGANRVNAAGVATAIGEALRRPDAKDVRDITGFAIGGIPPLGHTSALLTFMDEALLGYEVIWAAAGTPDAVFSVAPARLAAATGARIICVI